MKNISGFNLNIDPSIHEICKTSNSSSGSTRGTIYLLVLICILAFVASWNVNPFNWTGKRIELYEDKLDSLEVLKLTCDDLAKNQKELLPTINSNLNQKTVINRNDSIKEIRIKEIKIKNKILLYQNKLNHCIKNREENFLTIKLPLIGYSFDTNSLNVIIGVSFIVILLILYYTLYRESNNLKIALRMISLRYNDESDADIFVKQPNLSEINKERRRYHYEFLTMNEVFNLPTVFKDEFPSSIRAININKGMLLKNSFRFILRYIFYLPLLPYSLIIFFDFITQKTACDISCYSTWRNYLFVSFIIIVMIFGLCYACTLFKKSILKQFEDFRDNDYKLENLENL